MSTQFRYLGMGFGRSTNHLWGVQFAIVMGFTALALSACVSHFASDPILNQNDSTVDSSTSPECQFVSHDFGKTEICSQPQRVIALSPYELDLSLALGVQPVGYAEDSRALVGSPGLGEAMSVKYLGNRITHPPTYVGTWQSPSLEAILKLKPDLILRQYLDQTLYDHLSQIAPVILPNLDGNFDKWQEDILILGQVMKREVQAQQVLKTYQQEISRINLELQPISQTQQVLLVSMSDIGAIEVFTDKTFAGDLLKDLGFQLIIPKPALLGSGVITISLETLPQLQPEIIIVMASGNSSVKQVKALWLDHPILKGLPASRAGRVYFVDYQLWSRITGPIAAELMINEVRELLVQPKAD